MGGEAKRQIRELVKSAEVQGWRVEQLKSGHLKFYPPDVSLPAIVVSGTPSDWRSIKNFVAMLRRSGMKLDGLDDSLSDAALWTEPREKCPR